MSLRALVYAYVLGGLTLPPLLLLLAVCYTVYSSVPVPAPAPAPHAPAPAPDPDAPPSRRAWLTVRRTFEPPAADPSYVALVRSYLDARSRDPRRSRPRDMWYVVLKGTVLYLYEDERMTECGAAVELGSHTVRVHPEGLLDGELFARRNAICLRPRPAEHADEHAQPEDPRAPWFLFVRSCVDMEDWYLALVHASAHPSGTPALDPLQPVFLPAEMNWLVATLDDQPDVIPMRWFNALLGRVFYSFYRTQVLESYIIARIMKKLSKVKRPAFLTDVAVTQFSVGNKAPTLSKPMLKELTKEGDASIELGLAYKGAIRATVEASVVINLGARFKPYTVKIVLAVVIRELEGNLLVKVKRPPSSRIWYAFTKPPRMAINVEPIVSDRQITWSMILNTIEAKIEEMIADSVVLPNMDDISFFDSSQCEHRGGVWADAARLDKLMTPEVATRQTVQVADETQTEPESIPMESVPLARATTTSSEKTFTTVRRRSWFMPSADAGPSGLHANAAEEQCTLDGSPTPLPDTSSRQPPDTSDNEPESLSPPPQSRSSRALSVSSSVGGDESSSYLSDTSATSKSPRQPSTASTFLSTLKSKAGDKQALSNTAKEAMRKWGVNWGLKKDTGVNLSPDDLGDFDHRAHHNYADVRAAVIERREREQDRVNGSTSPIPIPQGGRLTASQSSGSTSPVRSRSLGDGWNDPFKDRVTEDHPAPSLIHTQPSQARTMTIPGIHASHKGEVMSMGNAPPDSPVLDSKAKGPAIQTMYRLWKSPILTGQSSEETSASMTSTSSGRDQANDGNQDVIPLSLTPEVVSPPARAVPPPLPPRSVSSVVVKQAAEEMDRSVSPASEALKVIASRDETRRLSESMQPSGVPDTASTAVPSPMPNGRPPLPPRRNPV